MLEPAGSDILAGFTTSAASRKASVHNLASQVGTDVVFALPGGATVELNNFDINLLGSAGEPLRLAVLPLPCPPCILALHAAVPDYRGPPFSSAMQQEPLVLPLAANQEG